MRWVIVLAPLLLAAGASAEEPLPVPPIPPTEPPSRLAPIPAQNLDGQFIDARPAVSLDVDINHRATPVLGFGYAPGARYQIDNDRRFFTLPGVLVRVPLP